MKRFAVFALGCGLALLLAAAPTGAEARVTRMCPMIYRPVCAMTPMGMRKTFSNACIARNAHAHVLYNGRCRFRHH